MTLRRGILVSAIVLIALVLGVGSIVWRHLAASSDSVPVSTAVSEFQQSAKRAESGPPRPGVYTYSLHGTECAGVLGVRLCRAFPAQARMILTRRPGTITIEDDLSQDHIETSRYTIHSDGRYLAWQRTKLVFGISQDDSAPTIPSTLALPATLRVGFHWNQRFATGGIPVATTNQITQKTTMIVGGTPVTVFEIDASSQTGGAHAGTETDRTWHSPSTGLDVRLIVHRRIGGAFPYTMDIDAALLSLKPLV
ncbi:MAG TPA: hypothetical protein VNL35_12695 [Chloroflexota bacterium]|nr:hypothetical protein [Chloroflexota bacterium]